MAQIDPSIAMSFRPIQIESPVNQMAAIAQLRGAQEASQMNALKLQEYQQQQREKNELARIMGDSNLAYGSDDFMRQVLARAPSQYETIATRIAQREDIKERTAKREFETQKLKADIRQRQLEEFKTAQKDISAFNSIQEVKDDIDRKVGSGLLPEDMAANILAGLPTDDGKFPAWKKQTLMKLMTAEKQLEFTQPKPEKVDLGGKIVMIDMNPNSDTFKQQIRQDDKTAAPRQSQLLTPEEERQKVRIAAAGRAPAAIPTPTVTMVLDPNDSTRMLSVDAKTYKGGSVNSPGVIGIAGDRKSVV